MQTNEQQIFDTINKAGRILIVLPQNPNGDAVGAGLAFFGFTKKLDKQPEIVSAAKDLQAFSFLPDLSAVKNSLEVAQSFVISVATQNTPLGELSYETKEGRVDIFLKPKSGKYTQSDVSFKSAKFPYDLIVTVAVSALEHLGEIYEKNTDLFFETPILNIDHHPNNEYFGEINYVDVAATSTSEILTALIESFEGSLIDEDIATSLLTGIIVETNSFQHVKTTPRAFLKASNLIALGGRHPDIIRSIYKTKNISLLKLWGRALARIRELPELGLVYSLVNLTDVQKTGASGADVLGVMKELVANLVDRKIILLAAETAPREIVGYYYLHPNIKAQIFTTALSGQMINGSLGTFRIAGRELLQAEAEILAKIQKIKEQINIA